MKEEAPDREELLKTYVESVESAVPTPAVPTPSTASSTIQQVGPNITAVGNITLPWQKEPSPIGNQIGWIPLPIEDLPTRGMFYPIDTTVAIRSANGGEIRHWSTLNETSLTLLDDMLNYIVERCVTIKSSNPNAPLLSWKDIKEVDRFYLLLAIHELTFPNGENKLQVKISDTKKLDVTKDMVSYITLDPKLMKYYDADERCFILKIKNGAAITIDIPSVGVTQWIKQYIQRKQRAQEFIDEDYLAFAPFVIKNWRGLSDDIFSKF